MVQGLFCFGSGIPFPKLIHMIVMHLQKHTYDMVTESLDDSKSYKRQTSYKLDRICRKVDIILPHTPDLSLMR